jgi:hypothetical protein
MVARDKQGGVSAGGRNPLWTQLSPNCGGYSETTFDGCLMQKFILIASLILPTVSAAQTAGPHGPVIAQPGDAALIKNCDGLFNGAKTYALARNWVDAWNSTSVDRVMALYSSDFEFRARGILPNNRISSPSGILRGQADNRLRWFDPAAGSVKPAGTFRLIDAYAGVRSIAVHYLNAQSEPVVEVMEFTPDCKIQRSNALYGPIPPGMSNAWEAYPSSPDGIVSAKPAAPR